MKPQKKHTMKNLFKTTTPKEVIEKTIGRVYEKPKLTAPVFEEALVRSWNHNIAYSSTIVKCKSGYNV